jgi:predicted DNA-binding transcriptional regulator AlpA
MPSLIKTPAVERKSAKKKSWIYDAQARALFPKSVSPGTWVEQEIDHFIELEIKARDLGLRGKAREDFIRRELAKPLTNGGHAR